MTKLNIANSSKLQASQSNIRKKEGPKQLSCRILDVTLRGEEFYLKLAIGLIESIEHK